MSSRAEVVHYEPEEGSLRIETRPGARGPNPFGDLGGVRKDSFWMDSPRGINSVVASAPRDIARQCNPCATNGQHKQRNFSATSLYRAGGGGNVSDSGAPNRRGGSGALATESGRLGSCSAKS